MKGAYVDQTLSKLSTTELGPHGPVLKDMGIIVLLAFS
jgi:hypothetical protein